MKYLIMDTSHVYLNIGLLQEDTLVASYAQPSNKSQSENIVPKLNELFEQTGWIVDDLDGVVITKGPGSYTGVRIAMSVAKVLCSTKKLPLFTVSTLQAFAGIRNNVLVVLDARSKRVYAGLYDKGQPLMEDCILSIEDATQLANEKNYDCVGDASLLDRSSLEIQLLENIVSLKPLWELVNEVHQVTPTYLKEQDAYGK